MTVKSRIKNAVYRDQDNLVAVDFTENDRALRMMVPGDHVWNSVREMVLSRIYERDGWFSFAGIEGSAIDAGSHVGFFGIMASLYAKQVVALEADPINAKTLEINLLLNEIDNVTVVNRALWSSDEELHFDREHAAASGSGQLGSSGISVRGITLSEVLEQAPDASVMKIDIEGAEFPSLMACDDFGPLTTIIGELHEPQASAEVRDLVAHLERHGFEVDVLDEPYFYSNEMRVRARQNRHKVSGQLMTKALVEPYYLLGAKLPTGRELPGLFARRR